MTSVNQGADDNVTDFRSVFVRRGRNGWGNGLELTPTPERHTVISVTGGGVHPVAQRIADLSGAKVVDGFKTHIADEEVLAAVINCGGTARIGIYPRKRIPTVDVFPGEPGGPLAQFITEDIFVSAVGAEDISLTDAAAVPAGAAAGTAAVRPADPFRDSDTAAEQIAEGGPAAGPLPPPPAPETPSQAPRGFFVKFGTSIGYIITTFLAAGRQSINLTLNTVLPFMAYVSILLGFVIYTGVAEAIGIGFIVALPFLSPILGPGAAVAQIVGVLMGTQIATGALPVQYALPTLFAIDGQVGCDFVPVGLGLGEAKAETVEVGTPAVLFSRMFTSPLAVLIAWLASFGL
jgi:PTS system glucitol/sorbitol-specific IIB component